MVNLLPQDKRSKSDNGDDSMSSVKKGRPVLTMHEPVKEVKDKELGPAKPLPKSGVAQKAPQIPASPVNKSRRSTWHERRTRRFERPKMTENRKSIPPKNQPVMPPSHKKETPVPSAPKPAVPAAEHPKRKFYVPPPTHVQKSNSTQKGAFSVNLVLEDTLKVLKETVPRKLKSYILISVVTLFVMIGLWALLSWQHLKVFTEIQNVNNELYETQLAILQYKKESSDVIQLRGRFNTLSNLLETHIYWTKFFGLLEKYTLEDVYYTGFSMQSKPGATITLSAKARSVEALAEQIVILENASDFVTNVRTNGFTKEVRPGEDDIVNFELIMTLTDSVFYISNNTTIER